MWPQPERPRNRPGGLTSSIFKRQPMKDSQALYLQVEGERLLLRRPLRSWQPGLSPRPGSPSRLPAPIQPPGPAPQPSPRSEPPRGPEAAGAPKGSTPAPHQPFDQLLPGPHPPGLGDLRPAPRLASALASVLASLSRAGQSGVALGTGDGGRGMGDGGRGTGTGDSSYPSEEETGSGAVGRSGNLETEGGRRLQRLGTRPGPWCHVPGGRSHIIASRNPEPRPSLQTPTSPTPEPGPAGGGMVDRRWPAQPRPIPTRSWSALCPRALPWASGSQGPGRWC